MAWAETGPMDERVKFIGDVRRKLYGMSELCARYGISRKTGYKWKGRYEAEGLEGLKDRSRAPGSCCHRMSEEAAEAILEARRSHPRWGPRKLLAWLKDRRPELELPAASSAGVLLVRAGLVMGRQGRRRRDTHPGRPTVDASAPNQLWTVDFKGQFRMGDGSMCYPLTVVDQHSRWLLLCDALASPSLLYVQLAFERLFGEVGLPSAILTDNGSPFSGSGLGGFTQLSAWWTRLGIECQRIQRGHPEQNGSHERMHRTLKAETARPPQPNRRAQQRRFDAFRREYNEERPHEALGQKPPSSLWQPPRRRFPRRLPEPSYPGHYERRQIRSGGVIKFRGQQVFISHALRGQTVGLEEVDFGVWSLYFCDVLIARLDERTGELR